MKRGTKRRFELILGGALVGAANGLFGGGGGMLAVPLLTKSGHETKRAHATAIAVILPASIVSGIVYLFNGCVPISFLVPAALGVVSGGFFGAKLLGVLPERIVCLLFALLMAAAGLRMLF